MQMRYAIACDYASATQDGRLNIVGVIDRLYAAHFPAIHRTLFLVASMEIEPEDDGQQREVNIQLLDSDARILADLCGHLRLGHGDRILNQVHVFQDLRFDSPGVYRFNVFLDGVLAKTLDMELVRVEPPVIEGDGA